MAAYAMGVLGGKEILDALNVKGVLIRVRLIKIITRKGNMTDEV